MAKLYTYRVDVYSGGRWVVVGTIKRHHQLKAAWAGAAPGNLPGAVKLTRVENVLRF